MEVTENDQRNNSNVVDSSDSDASFNENADDVEEELMNIQGVPVTDVDVEFEDLPFPEEPVEPIGAQRIPLYILYLIILFNYFIYIYFI